MSNQYKEFKDVPTHIIAERVVELGEKVASGDFSDFSMRVPGEYDRDADLVMTGAGLRLNELQAQADKAEAALAAANAQIEAMAIDLEAANKKLAELEGQKPIGYFAAHPVFGFYEQQIGPSDTNIAFYARPVLADTAQVPDEWLDFARDIATNYDCDNDAHKYGTPCRACSAEKLLQSQPATSDDLVEALLSGGAK